MQTWSLSYLKQNQRLGTIIIDAQNFLCAIAKASSLGINPSGAVQGSLLESKIRKYYKDKVLTDAQVRAAKRCAH
jgi:hypothetical protein